MPADFFRILPLETYVAIALIAKKNTLKASGQSGSRRIEVCREDYGEETDGISCPNALDTVR